MFSANVLNVLMLNYRILEWTRLSQHYSISTGKELAQLQNENQDAVITYAKREL